MVGVTAVLALTLRGFSPRQPVLRHYGVAYTAGLLATMVIKAV
ncbi:hypothetical protein [Streptomyces sp. NPDC004284]